MNDTIVDTIAVAAKNSPLVMSESLGNALQYLGVAGTLIAAAGVIAAAVYAAIKGYYYVAHRREVENAEYTASFNTIIAQLSSDNPSSQLSAAILLRRFFEVKSKKGCKNLKDETINEISSLLRVLPTGIFQKTLGDGLAYAGDLTYTDLQRTNMQDLYIGSKNCRVDMSGSDLYMADLSYALIDNVNAKNVQFYNSILFNTQIKNTDLSGSNFMNADLNRVCFKNVILAGASFKNAFNVPEEIANKLVDGYYQGNDPVSTNPNKSGKKIFFSMPGCMTKEDEFLTKDYKSVLENLGYTVVYYKKDDYPKFGQLNKIRHSIESSNAMIVFGLRQINISTGSYHKNTPKEEAISDKWMSTPWNELEVGMGLMAGLPILLVKDDAIDSGVFDSNLSECFIASMSTNCDSRTLETNKDLITWLAKF